jgi:Holliday junction resolvase RusA-like endonuclease
VEARVIEVELPYPPSLNHYWRHVGPRVLISRQGRRFRDEVGAILRARGVRPMDGQIRLVIDLYPPDRRRRDCDNAMKALLDALQHGGAYRDDSQVARLEVERRGVEPGGKTVVRIEEMERC